MDRFEATNKRSVKFIFLILFFGIMIGSIMREVIHSILPTDLTVTLFFTKYIELGSKVPVTIDLGIMQITAGFLFEISVCSIIGLFSSWYFLRYFK